MTEAFAPAKINLLLIITGVRADGFHNLVSLVAPLELGDRLRMEMPAGLSADTLACDAPGVPTDATNLVLKAAAAYRTRVPAAPYAAFVLEKAIPHGAGLGGGSSDAAAALKLMNKACAGALSPAELAAVAATVGSDCPLFLADAPVVMRGRGELVEVLQPAEHAALRGRRVLVFKPAFGVSTVEAYQAMRAHGGYYRPESIADTLIDAWRSEPTVPPPCFNNMTYAVGDKHVALVTMLEQLESQFGLEAHLSGSGSACFALLEPGYDAAPVIAAIRAGWGDTAFIADTRLR